MIRLVAKDIMFARVSLYAEDKGSELVKKHMINYPALPVVNNDLEVLNTSIVEESESMMRVMATLNKKEPRIARYLLSYLGVDEAGHRELVGKLNELKLAAIQIL